MGIKIRQAKLRDISILDSFQGKIIDHERPLDPAIKRRGKIRYYSLNYIKRLIKSKSSIFLIAEINGKPIGCGFGEIKKVNEDWYKYKCKGCIGMMFVEKEYREKGIGGMVLEKLLAWFSKKKIEDVRIRVYHNNFKAVEFYKKHRFKDYILEMACRTR